MTVTQQRPAPRPPAPAPGAPGAAFAVVVGAVAVAVAVVLAWSAARPWGSRWVNTPARLGAVAGLAGLLGLWSFAVALVLSARVRLVERSLGGLDRVYRVHHWVGGVAFLLMALHPVLLAWRYGQVSWDRAWRVWWPVGADRATLAGQLAFYGVTVAITTTVFVRLRHQVLLWMQRLLGVLFVPAAYHALTVGGDTGEDAALRVLVWAIVAVGMVALVGHTLLGRFTAPHRRYRVREVRAHPGPVAEVWLDPVGRALAFVPGQFVFARFHDAPVSGESHPFSVASPPGDGPLRLTVKDLGDDTHHMGEVTPGTEVVVEGPYGRFSHRFVTGRRQVWVAGGIGIAPFLAMAASLPGAGYDVDLFYGFPTDADGLFLGELQRYAADDPSFRVHPVVQERDGFVSAALLAGRVGPLDGLGGAEFLLCGPPPMMHALQAQLHDAGVGRGRVHFEEFGFA